jgi:WhiB family transcriptional regulator, redox-sensing transcriptional regulator
LTFPGDPPAPAPARPGCGIPHGRGHSLRGVLDALAGLLHRPEWQRDALCLEYPSVSFFPERGEVAAAARAKAICLSCLVCAECRTAAFSAREHYGIWGGLSESDRRHARQDDPTLRTDARLTGGRHVVIAVSHRPRARCGTELGCKAHYALGEKPCDACREPRGGRASAHLVIVDDSPVSSRRH